MTEKTPDNAYSVDRLTEEARRLAAEYRRTTGKTLPLSPEIAINDAIRLLNLSPTNEEGCDAIRDDNGHQYLVQIKGRVIFDRHKGGHRIGQLKLEQPWDELALVIMDESYETAEIYLATRDEIESALGSNTSNKRGAMTVNQFKVIANRVWPAA